MKKYRKYLHKLDYSTMKIVSRLELHTEWEAMINDGWSFSDYKIVLNQNRGVIRRKIAAMTPEELETEYKIFGVNTVPELVKFMELEVLEATQNKCAGTEELLTFMANYSIMLKTPLKRFGERVLGMTFKRTDKKAGIVKRIEKSLKEGGAWIEPYKQRIKGGVEKDGHGVNIN